MQTHRAPHVFVDETKAHDYVMVATTVLPSDVNGARKNLRGLLLPRQERLHFTHERPQRRRQLMAAMCELNVQVHVYVAETRDHASGRHACMKSLLDDALVHHAQLLTIERDESVEHEDRRLIAERFRREPDPPRYRHVTAKEEPLLWISDAVAWCYQRGGEWRSLCESIVQTEKAV